MVKLYATLIKKGMLSLDDIPLNLRLQVEQELNK